MGEHAEQQPDGPLYAEYFGFDKVALFAAGGMPAAPPAPEGSNARRAGDTAVADALSKVGSTEARPGLRPAVLPAKPNLKEAMRRQAERAQMEASQRRHTGASRGIAPHSKAGWFWRAVFVPFYKLVPWGLRKTLMRSASGVKGWSTKR